MVRTYLDPNTSELEGLAKRECGLVFGLPLGDVAGVHVPDKQLGREVVAGAHVLTLHTPSLASTTTAAMQRVICSCTPNLHALLERFDVWCNARCKVVNMDFEAAGSEVACMCGNRKHMLLLALMIKNNASYHASDSAAVSSAASYA